MKAMSGDHVLGERSLYYMGAMCTYIHIMYIYIYI